MSNQNCNNNHFNPCYRPWNSLCHNPCHKPCNNPWHMPCNNPCHKPCNNPCHNPCNNPCNDGCHNQCSVENLENLVKEYQDVEAVVDNDFTKALEELLDALDYFKDGMAHSAVGDEIRCKIICWFEECMCHYNGHNSCQCEEFGERINKLIDVIEKLTCESYEYTKQAAEKLAEAKKLDSQLQKLKEEFAQHCFPRPCNSECENNCHKPCDNNW